MATFDLTAADNLSKIHFGPRIEKQFNTAAKLYNKVAAGRGEAISNRGYEVPIHVNPNAAISWFSDGGTLPAGGGQDIKRSLALYKRFALAVRLTGDAIDSTSNDAVAYAKAMAFNVKNATIDAIKYLNIYSFLDGTGFLTTANADNQNADSTVTPFALTVADSRYLRKGMTLDIHDGVTSTVLGTVEVQAITSATVISTLKTAGTLTDVDTGDSIAITGSFNKVMHGLDLLIDDTDVAGGVQGIDRGDVPEFQANVITLSGSPALSRDHLRRGEARIQISLGDDGPAYEVWSHPAQLHAYADMGWPMKRFQGGGAGKMDLGFTAYEWEGKKWVVDTDAPKDKLYFLNAASMFKVSNRGLSFDDKTGSIWNRVTSSTAGRYTDAFEAYLMCRMNLGIYVPRANTKIEGLAVTGGY